jgi:NAD(P)-dependent dehydrogenase (short-subunit alcohol dehydrogenase family)
MTYQLDGKVALIAGGGLGIGRASAILLARAGARVVITDVNSEAGQDTVNQIKAVGGNGNWIQADVSLFEDVKNCVEFTLDTYHGLDILFSSVGIYARAKLADTEEDLWDRIMRINVKSAYLLCKAVVPHMISAGGGSIILSASSVGWHGSAANIAAYATSKFAITGLTKSAACDYLQDNIRVNCICPGPTDTPMIRGGRTPEELQTFISGLPIKRLADPIEMAKAVLFLASDESAFITGVALPVDGGQTAWI